MKALYAASALLLILAACGDDVAVEEEEIPWPRTYVGKISWTDFTFAAQWGVQGATSCGPSEALDATVTAKQDGTLTIVATLAATSAQFDEDGSVSRACSYGKTNQFDVEGRYTATDDGGVFEIPDGKFKWVGTFNEKGLQGTLADTDTVEFPFGSLSVAGSGTFSGEIQ